MKTKPYFTITINAQSPSELKMRIADNESRGFELVATHDIEKESNVIVNSQHRSLNGDRKYRHAGTDVHKSYRAEMRRKNEVLE